MQQAFIDTNIFMYAIGGHHPHKAPSEHVIQQIVAGELEAVINTEVLQEILYRYSAIGKPQIGFQLFDTLIETFAIIWSVEKEDVVQARTLQAKYGIKTRDAVHTATMQRNAVTTLYSYDTDFDTIPGIQRCIPHA